MPLRCGLWGPEQGLVTGNDCLGLVNLLHCFAAQMLPVQYAMGAGFANLVTKRGEADIETCTRVQKVLLVWAFD